MNLMTNSVIDVCVGDAAATTTAAVKLSDEARLEKVTRWNSLLNGRNVLQDREDITGYEKLREDKAVTDEMTILARELLEDTKLRLAAKEKVPEPEDQMTAPVKKLTQQGVSSQPLVG